MTHKELETLLDEFQLKTKEGQIETLEAIHFQMENLKTENERHVNRITQTESNLHSIHREMNKFRSEFYDLILAETLREPDWRAERVDALTVLQKAYGLLGITNQIDSEARFLNIHLEDGPF